MHGASTASRLLLGLLMLAHHAHAQFFQNMFHSGQFFTQSSEQEAQRVGDASWFRDRVNAGMCPTCAYAAKCDDYLCSDTLACVKEPHECPCPFTEQLRCPIGDAYVCVPRMDCSSVESLYHL